MVKSIPTSIQGQLKFPTSKQDNHTPVNYKVAAISELEGGVNLGAILTFKILMHLDRP